MRHTGIYAIENIVNGKRYIGSAVTMGARWKVHRQVLRRGSAPRKLQNAWRKYGEGAFRFRKLLICRPEDLLFYEQRAIDAYDAVDNGYNTRRTAESNLGLRLGPPSLETRAKISEANRRRGKGRPGPWPKGKRRPAEMNAKQSATRRERSKKYEFDGRSMCLSDWAEHIGISVNGLGNRLKKGWPIERALTEPSRGY